MQWERIGLNRARLCGALALIICALPNAAIAGPTPGPAAAAGDAGAIGVSGIDMRSDPAPIRAPAIATPTTSPIRPSAAQLALPRPYPLAPKGSVSERMFGELVPDPWRWLEGDVHADKAVAAWVSAENKLSRAYLDALPGRAHFVERLRALYDSPRISVPRKAGHRYFFLSNSGLANQSALYVRDGLGGADRLLLDPNAASDAYAIDGWVPSHSGRWLAYAEQRNGSDWRTIRVIDADSGKLIDDRLDWANDTLIGWLGDTGFFYSRYPAPPEGDRYRAALHDKAVWFHRVGTPQSADSLVYATPEHPEWGHKAMVTSDGRWAVISTDAGAAGAHAIHLIDLGQWKDGAPWSVIPFVPEPVKDWRLIDGIDNHLWFITDDGAPNGQVLRIDMGPHPHARVVVSEGRGTLQAGRIVGDRLILSYLSGGQSLAMVTDLGGRPARAITIDAVGSASGFDGRPGDPETFYQFSSYNQSPAIWRMDLRTGRVSPFANARPPVNPADYVIEQREYPSHDGTMVPLTVVRKRSLSQTGTPAPTLLYGYGGFDIALNPGWSPWRMAWLEAGGVFAVAAVRGGGELGPAWYEAGRKDHKQASFDDFIAAGEYLLKSGIARPGSLAAQGGSNGGMMVAAVINQRPDLFVAANPDVGVMDMLRFDRFTQGRAWIGDYGDPGREADWRTLRAYSPYHNIHAGAAYPAILVTTADTDDRVVPAHSFKYVAALQDAAIGDRPHLLRVESDAGHGAGRPLDKAIAGGADVLAFLAAWTGLGVNPQ